MRASFARRPTFVLAISDEVQLQRLLRSILDPMGCKIVAAPHSAEAPSGARPDIVIVDFDRLEPADAAKTKDAFPDAEIIALCNAYSEVDCVAVLELGVEYLPRPFREQDLSARVRAAQLRRLTARGYRRHYRHGAFAIDLLDWIVTRDGRPIFLTPSELHVLVVLAQKPGHVATFPEILAGLGRADTWRGRQILHAYVVGLRRKIEQDPKHPVLILNEARVGYQLAAEPSAPAALAENSRLREEK
jgi:two-component system, OmpR family, KDP operon response regulator KdpE